MTLAEIPRHHSVRPVNSQTIVLTRSRHLTDSDSAAGRNTNPGSGLAPPMRF